MMTYSQPAWSKGGRVQRTHCWHRCQWHSKDEHMLGGKVGGEGGHPHKHSCNSHRRPSSPGRYIAQDDEYRFRTAGPGVWWKQLEPLRHRHDATLFSPAESTPLQTISVDWGLVGPAAVTRRRNMEPMLADEERGRPGWRHCSRPRAPSCCRAFGGTREA